MMDTLLAPIRSPLSRKRPNRSSRGATVIKISGF
jgi:hypothetical protein